MLPVNFWHKNFDVWSLDTQGFHIWGSWCLKALRQHISNATKWFPTSTHPNIKFLCQFFPNIVGPEEDINWLELSSKMLEFLIRLEPKSSGCNLVRNSFSSLLTEESTNSIRSKYICQSADTVSLLFETKKTKYFLLNWFHFNVKCSACFLGEILEVERRLCDKLYVLKPPTRYLQDISQWYWH